MGRDNSYRVYVTTSLDCNPKHKDGIKRYYYALQVEITGSQGFNGVLTYNDLGRYAFSVLDRRLYKSLDKTSSRIYKTETSITRKHEIVVTIMR